MSLVLTTKRAQLEEFRAFSAQQIRNLSLELSASIDEEILFNTNLTKFIQSQGKDIFDPQVAEAFLTLHKRHSYNFIISRDNSFLGVIGLRMKSENDRISELFYWINKPFRCNGYASEIVPEVLRFAFKDLNYQKIMAQVIDSNLSSSSILKKNGFRYVGRLEDEILRDKRYYNLDVFELLKFRWREFK